MLHSMTGFAALKGVAHGFSWGWDLRSVNSKGLDLRLRVPDWIDGLEAALRRDLGKSLARGAVTLSLRVYKDEEEAQIGVGGGHVGIHGVHDQRDLLAEIPRSNRQELATDLEAHGRQRLDTA